jgi:hypothetical protein
LHLASLEDIMEKMRNGEDKKYKWYWRFNIEQDFWELEDWYIYKKWVKIRWKNWEDTRKNWDLIAWKNWEKEKDIFFKMLCNLWLADRSNIIYILEKKYEMHYGDLFLKIWEDWQAKRETYIAYKILKNLYKKRKKELRTNLQLRNEFRIKKFKEKKKK